MSDNNCLFCKIAEGKIPTNNVFEDDQAIAFRDINPQAPTHILLIPKEHIASLNDTSIEFQTLLGHLLCLAPRIARQEGIAESGFRVIVNTGTDAGQSVGHIHLHLMGGRPMNWPPG